MRIRNLALSMIAIGVLIIVAGVYGVTRQYSAFALNSGIFFAIAGVAMLLWVSRPLHLSIPHIYVIGISTGALALHSFEHFCKSEGETLSIGYLLWAMMPYIFCLIFSAFSSVRTAVISGVVLALAFDLWGYYSVFINPQSSTAALVLLFIPLWSTIIVIPFATFITWFVKRRLQKTAP